MNPARISLVRSAGERVWPTDPKDAAAASSRRSRRTRDAPRPAHSLPPKRQSDLMRGRRHLASASLTSQGWALAWAGMPWKSAQMLWMANEGRTECCAAGWPSGWAYRREQRTPPWECTERTIIHASMPLSAGTSTLQELARYPTGAVHSQAPASSSFSLPSPPSSAIYG